MERQGTAIGDQPSGDRLRELEAENARLKSLVGELLVTNQLLREDRKSIRKQMSEDAGTSAALLR
jgi:hypothetical protein